MLGRSRPSPHRLFRKNIVDAIMRIEVPIFTKEREQRLAQIPHLQDLAVAGDFKAQLQLAWELAEGRVIDADFGEAFRMFEKAAASSDENALLDFARFLHLRRVPDGLRTIRKFALKGNFRAQFWLAQHYQSRRGRINQLRSAVWFRRSQQNGSIGAGFALLGQQVRLASILIKPFIVIKAVIVLCRTMAFTKSDKIIEEEVNHLLTRLKRR